MKILLIAYLFPPFQDAQSLRWYYLTGSLAALGVQIDVLSITHPDRMSWSLNDNVRIMRINPGMIENIALKAKESIGVDKANNRIIRTKKSFGIMKSLYRIARRFAGAVFPGDVRTEWFPFAMRSLKRMNLKSYDFVITSHEPWVSSLIGLKLKKRYPEIRWIADFGDPYVVPYTPKHKLWIENRIERSVYSNADALLFTNPFVIKHIRNKYPELERKKILLLGHGFSKEAFGSIKTPEKKNNVFTLIYTGSLYRGFRDPASFIKALYSLNINFIFKLAGRNERFIKDFEVLGNRFVFLGFIDHNSILHMLKDADVLVYISNTDPVQVPGKLYEYLGAMKPVLAICSSPDDPAWGLVEDLRCGIACSNEPEEIKNALSRLYEKWLNYQKRPILNYENIENYSWEHHAKVLHSELEKIMS